MSETWDTDQAESATRVPVWTRATPTRFSARLSGFAALADAGADDLGFSSADMPPVDPLAQGFAEGYAAGEAALADDRIAVRRLAEGLAALRPEPTADLALLLAETVKRLVTQIFGEVALDEAAIAHRTAAAAALIAEESAPARLRVAPADAARLQGAELPVEIVSDFALTEGTLLLETTAGWVEDGPAVRLDRLRAALDALAR